MFKDGKRLRDWSMKDLPAFCGKLLPEFNNRRSIKDMFTRKPTLPTSKSNVERANSFSTAAGKTGEGQESEPADEEISQDSTRQSLPPPSTAGSSTSSLSVPSSKRRPSNPQLTKPAKKSKLYATSKSTAPSKGQQSLTGFFKRKEGSSTSQGTVSSIPEAPLSTRAVVSLPSITTDPERVQILEDPLAANIPDTEPTTPIPSTPKLSHRRFKLDQASIPPTPTPFALSSSAQSDRSESTFVDPIVSKESWNKLFTKKPNPLCEGHNEPCKTLQTKKPGPNRGRSFWMCARYVFPFPAPDAHRAIPSADLHHTDLSVLRVRKKLGQSGVAGPLSGQAIGIALGHEPPESIHKIYCVLTISCLSTSFE
jgi:AP endonuclease-2